MNDGQIKVLDISYYIACPPVSGGSLRMISPLAHMDPSSGIVFDFVFSTWSNAYAVECSRYLLDIPVIRRAEGVVSYHYNEAGGHCPEGFSEDVWRTMSMELRERVIELVLENDYDIVQIEHSQLSWIVPFIRIADPDVHIVLDSHNVEYLVYERWVPYAEPADAERIGTKCRTLKEWEGKVWKWYDSAFTISPVEERMLRAGGMEKTYLVPTGGGIDPDKYEPKHPVTDKKYDILYIGTMDWFPNVHGLIWFIDEVFPSILERRPETVLHIVGSGAMNAKLESRSSKHIRIWGQQKDDVAFFHNSKVFIVPLWIGAGARVKIITAWASKIPVVSTSLGAEGIDAIPGENMIIDDDPKGFASSVLDLLDDPERRRMISDRAFDVLLDRYSVRCCVDRLVSAYREMCGRRSPCPTSFLLGRK